MKMMKIVSLLVCVVCLCVLPGAWGAQKLTNQVAPTQSPTPGLSSGVTSVAPARLSTTASGGALNRTPVRLSAQKRTAIINEIRMQAGKQRLEVPPSIDELVLTPSQPGSDRSWLACLKGTFFGNQHGRADVFGGDDKSQIELEFNLPLRSGSFYLVDCTVQSFGNKTGAGTYLKETADWTVIGTQESTIAEEGGHMCFSFRAGGPSAHFVIKPKAYLGRVFRVELTRVP